MSRTDAPAKNKTTAYRQRLRLAGRIYLNTALPNELVKEIDNLKAERGVPSRALIIEEAVRIYIEKAKGMK